MGTEAPHVQVVAVAGEADAAVAPRLKSEIFGGFDDGRRHVVVDLSRVEFVDSSVLAVFVGAHKRARRANGSIQLASPPQLVRDILSITGLSEILPVAETVDDALATIPGDGAASNA